MFDLLSKQHNRGWTMSKPGARDSFQVPRVEDGDLRTWSITRGLLGVQQQEAELGVESNLELGLSDPGCPCSFTTGPSLHGADLSAQRGNRGGRLIPLVRFTRGCGFTCGF